MAIDLKIVAPEIRTTPIKVDFRPVLNQEHVSHLLVVQVMVPHETTQGLKPAGRALLLHLGFNAHLALECRADECTRRLEGMECGACICSSPAARLARAGFVRVYRYE